MDQEARKESSEPQAATVLRQSEPILKWVNLEDTMLRSSQRDPNPWTEDWPTLLSVLHDVNRDDSEEIYRHGTTASEASKRSDVSGGAQTRTSPPLSSLRFVCGWEIQGCLRQHKVRRGQHHLFLNGTDRYGMDSRKEERSRGGQSCTGFRSQPTSIYTEDAGMNRLQPEIPFSLLATPQVQWHKNSEERQQTEWLVSEHNAAIPCKSCLYLVVFLKYQ